VAAAGAIQVDTLPGSVGAGRIGGSSTLEAARIPLMFCEQAVRRCFRSMHCTDQLSAFASTQPRKSASCPGHSFCTNSMASIARHGALAPRSPAHRSKNGSAPQLQRAARDHVGTPLLEEKRRVLAPNSARACVQPRGRSAMPGASWSGGIQFHLGDEREPSPEKRSATEDVFKLCDVGRKIKCQRRIPSLRGAPNRDPLQSTALSRWHNVRGDARSSRVAGS